MGRVLHIGTIEGLRIREDGRGLVEGDAVLREIGRRLCRVPLEHAGFSIYKSPSQLRRRLTNRPRLPSLSPHDLDRPGRAAERRLRDQ